MAKNLDNEVYEICAHCLFFIEIGKDGRGQRYVMHLDNGEIDHDHDATPSGDKRTLAQWKRDRPELFPPNDIRYKRTKLA